MTRTQVLLAMLFASWLPAQDAAPRKYPSQPASWVDPMRAEPMGTHYRTFPSKLANSEISYLVYLPKSYESDTARRYPVVYWLHGMGGNQRAGATFLQQAVPVMESGKVPE